ncbi:putative RAB-20 [Ixodes scapularis]|uniref:RAB-20, putative n=1 Tax=Ixodes scapularis TaxID=6945 RepID=B7PNJ7_IXOSC|nr:RAB-20, putative [Ixodes scapularis]|eukprot:XP_002435345.1 RAB-20, putative [Ixodes scapularis]
MGLKLQTADLKVVILGDANVGKTSLLVRYLEKRFDDRPKSTVGASFTLKMWGKYNIAIWDTAGQERYIGLSSFYCRNADVAIMAFDITNRESYKALMTRYVELLHMVDDFALKVVVGTKTDLLKDYKRQVSSAEAEMFARNLNHTAAKDKAPYFETSSVTGNNIETVFEYIVERCYPGSPLLSCCLRQTHEQEHKSVALTPRVLRFAKTTAGCCL